MEEPIAENVEEIFEEVAKLTPWGFLAWLGFLLPVLFTWFFVPLYLKNSRGIFGEWYREFSDEGEHEDQKMVNTVISRPAAFLYSLSTFSVGISIWWSGALSVGEASHATVAPTLHYMMGIAFGHNIYSLLYHFINADWNDRFSQFLTNRQTWQGFARLFVYASALQNQHLGYFIMYRFIFNFNNIFEAPMLMMNMVLQREEDGGIWFTVCLIGFMVALPTKILLILFFQYRLLFNIFSDAYASVTFMTKMMLLIWTVLTDGFTLFKVATT